MRQRRRARAGIQRAFEKNEYLLTLLLICLLSVLIFHLLLFVLFLLPSPVTSPSDNTILSVHLTEVGSVNVSSVSAVVQSDRAQQCLLLT